MKGQTHAGAEKRVETSSSKDTMDVEKGKQKGLNAEDKADTELGPSGLSVTDVADQSAYESDATDVAHQAADSDRNTKS